MLIESNNQQPAINVLPSGYSNGGFGDAFGGNGFFWVIILFFFAIFGGWGNNGYAAGNNAMPYVMGGFGAGNEVRQGFDQASVMSGLNSISNNMCDNQALLLATMNANQNANIAAMNSLAMGLQNCCCENRASVADLKYTVSTENCADRAALNDALQAVTAQNNANTQRILDQMCNDKIDAKNEKIAELQNQLTMANLAASQNAQTAQILTDNLAQTQAIEQYLAPVPRPAYVVQNPNCCGTNYYTSSCGCGCNR